MAGKMNLQTIQCRCGAWRIRGDSCGDCGFKPRPEEAKEINALAVKRRQIALRIDQLVEAKLEERDDSPLYEEIVGTFPDGFIKALTRMIDKEATLADAEPMAEHVTRLECARRALLPKANLRPYAEQRAQLNVLEKMSTWWPIYRDVITEIDPERIRTQTTHGQRTIDSSRQAMIDIEPTIEAMTVLSDSDSQPSLVKRQIRALEIRYPGTPLSQLDEAGAEQVAKTMGVTCPPLMGLEHQMLTMLAESAFLPETFEDKIREATQLWRENPHRVQQIADMTRSIEDLADFSARFTEAFLRFEQGVQLAGHNRGAIRAAEKLLGSMYEDAQPLWTWNALLLGNSVAPGKYEKAAKENSTTHVVKLRHELPTITADSEAFYRNAAQHGTSVRPDAKGEYVLVSTNRGDRWMTATAFIDKVYALVESVLAMHWVARVFLTASGKLLPGRNDMPVGFGVTTRDEAFVFLEVQRGFHLLHDRIADGVWHLEADVPLTDIYKTAVTIALQSDADVAFVELTRPEHVGPMLDVSGNVVRSLRSEAGGPAGTTTEDDALLQRLNVRAASSFDREPVLSHTDLKYGVAVFGTRLLEDRTSLPEQIPRLRAVRRWAEQQGFDDVVDMYKLVLKTDRDGDSRKKKLACRKLRQYARSAPQPEFPLPTGVRVRTQ